MGCELGKILGGRELWRWLPCSFVAPVLDWILLRDSRVHVRRMPMDGWIVLSGCGEQIVGGFFMPGGR